MFDCLISFVIPAFNAGLTLERAVLSIVKQKGLNAEVLIINDGSTDNTKDIAEELADSWSCVRVINTVNGGVARARNIGIEAALGLSLIHISRLTILSCIARTARSTASLLPRNS